MGANALQIKPRYLVDDEGHRTAVMLSLEEYEALMELVEDTNDSEAFDRAVESSTGLRDLNEVVADLKRDGLL